jgi:hypothetical protein
MGPDWKDSIFDLAHFVPGEILPREALDDTLIAFLVVAIPNACIGCLAAGCGTPYQFYENVIIMDL